MKTISILALLMLIVTSGNTFAADDCAPALDFEKRRSFPFDRSRIFLLEISLLILGA